MVGPKKTVVEKWNFSTAGGKNLFILYKDKGDRMRPLLLSGQNNFFFLSVGWSTCRLYKMDSLNII